MALKRIKKEIHKNLNTKNKDYQCQYCSEQRYRLQNGEWIFFCVVCGTRFGVSWKRVSKRLIRL